MNRFLPVALLLAMSTGLAQTPAMPSPADLAKERELTQRALGIDYGLIAVEAKLLVGKLPPQPLGPLPSVPSGRLLGSVVRTSKTVDYPNSQMIFFDSSASVAQVQAALQRSLQAQGWTAFKRDGDLSPDKGFQAAETPESLAYYRLEQQVSFNAQVTRAGAVTRVTLNLNQDRNIREQIQGRERSGFYAASNLPTLRPPEGTTVQPSGGGGGGGSWNSSASIQSPLNVTQLLDAYGTQLKAQGWTLLVKSAGGKAATSVWRFTDQDKNDVTGVLTLRENAPNRYSAQLASLSTRN